MTIKIGLKLLIAFLMITSLVTVVSYANSNIYKGVLSDVEQLCHSSLVEMMSASEMSVQLHATQIAAHSLLTDKYHSGMYPTDDVEVVLEDRTDRKIIEENLRKFKNWLSVSRHATESTIEMAKKDNYTKLSIEEEMEISLWLEQLTQKYIEHTELMKSFLRIIEDNVHEANNFLKRGLAMHFKEEMLPLILEYQDDTKLELIDSLTTAKRALTRADGLARLAVISAFVAALILGFFISRSIAKPVNALKDGLLRIGQGDVNTRIQVKSSDEIGILANAFNQMSSELKTTTVSKSYVDNIIQSMGEMLIVVDAQGRIETVNRTSLRELEFPEDELLGKPITMLIPQGRLPQQELKGADINHFDMGECTLVTKGGIEIPVYWSGSELRDEEGNHRGMVYVGKNMVERKRVEEQLRTSLEEKEVLLKEIHHRVKNNLQVISSLLSLQSRRANDSLAESMFRESQNRILSMALIHEQLYQSQDLAKIDIVQYVHSLVRHLKRSFGEDARKISLTIDVDQVELSIDVAIPCGLLINELVSNSMEHAFPAGQSGKIWVAFKSERERQILSVGDNGIGLPKASDIDHTKTLGLELVRALVKQLDAELEISGRDGTQFVITFKQVSNEKNSNG